MYSRHSSWLGECVVVTVCQCVVCVIEYGWYVGRGDIVVCVVGRIDVGMVTRERIVM